MKSEQFILAFVGVGNDVDFKKVAEQVFLAADCGKLMKELGYTAPGESYREHVIMGKPFVADKAREYLESFPIKRIGS